MTEDTKRIEQQASLSASGEIMRMLFASVVAVMLLAGAVYWLRLVPAQNPAPDSGATTIQVRLLPATDPSPYPLAADEPLESPTTSTASQPSDEPAQDTPHAVTEATVLAPTAIENPPPTPAVSVETAVTRKAARDRAFKFQQALQRHIARYQRYPNRARERGLEGTVQVVFLLRRDGTILDAWVNSSSGQIVLDREAVATIRRAEPLPVIPSGLPDQLSVALPVAFELP